MAGGAAVARHRDAHYRTVARDIAPHVTPGATVLDYGCGEALHADLVAVPARRLILCEAAPIVRTALSNRFAGQAKIEVRSPEQVAEFLGRLAEQPSDAAREKRELRPDWRTTDRSPFLVLLFLLFCAVVSMEWGLRRWWGMV